MIKGIFLTAFSFLWLASLCQGQTPLENVQSLLQEAKDFRYSDLSRSFEASQKALEISREYGLDSVSAQVIAELAINYGYRAEYDKAFELNHEALRIAEHYGDTVTMIDATNNLGIDNYYLEDYEKAQTYFRRVLELSLAMGEKERIANSYNNLGLVASEFGRLDEEEANYLKALEVFKEIGSERGVAMINLNLGTIYLMDGRLELAEARLEESISSYEQLNIASGVVDAKGSMVELLAEKRQLGNAIRLAEETLDYSEANDLRGGELHMLELLNNLYLEAGDFKKAHAALSNLKMLSDSIINEETAENIAELETKYETQRKEQEIETLQMENQLSQLKIDTQNNQRNLLILFLIVFILLAIFLFWQYRFKQKTNKLLSEKNTTITQALREREVLLKEIHHRVKNNLQVISSLLNLQSRFIKDQGAIDAVKEGQNRVKSMALIHQKLYQEDNLAGVDAWEYFSSLGNSLIKSYGANVEMEIHTKEMKLDIDTAIPIGLILNEVISNSLKYAFEKDVDGIIDISMEEDSESLILNIADNGKGFDPTKLSGTGSFGMTLIQSLAQKLKATFEIKNEAGTNYIFNIKNYKLI